MPETEEKIVSDPEDFVRERNEILLACDVDKALAFQAKHHPGIALPTNRFIVEIGLHEARTAATDLPIEARRLSKQWLTERGYKSLDDGEL